MQTFLPYPDFTKSAKCLDNKRLGKQRVECLQILKALSDPNYGWQNHPAVKMWRGYEYRLTCYGVLICREWTDRGFKDTCASKIIAIQGELYNKLKSLWGSNSLGIVDEAHKPYPIWLGNPDFHASHRSNLLRKDPVYYSQFGWTESPDLPYNWPTN